MLKKIKNPKLKKLTEFWCVCDYRMYKWIYVVR